MKEKITEYIINLANEKGIVIEMDSDLYQFGVLDSMGLILLLAYLQDEFELDFIEDDMNSRNYCTINSVIAFCEQKKAKQV